MVSILLNHPGAYHAFDHSLPLEILPLPWHLRHSLSYSSYSSGHLYLIPCSCLKMYPWMLKFPWVIFNILDYTLDFICFPMIKTTNVLCSRLINILIDLKHSSLLFIYLIISQMETCAYQSPFSFLMKHQGRVKFLVSWRIRYDHVIDWPANVSVDVIQALLGLPSHGNTLPESCHSWHNLYPQRRF